MQIFPDAEVHQTGEKNGVLDARSDKFVTEGATDGAEAPPKAKSGTCGAAPPASIDAAEGVLENAVGKIGGASIDEGARATDVVTPGGEIDIVRKMTCGKPSSSCSSKKLLHLSSSEQDAPAREQAAEEGKISPDAENLAGATDARSDENPAPASIDAGEGATDAGEAVPPEIGRKGNETEAGGFKMAPSAAGTSNVMTGLTRPVNVMTGENAPNGMTGRTTGTKEDIVSKDAGAVLGKRGAMGVLVPDAAARVVPDTAVRKIGGASLDETPLSSVLTEDANNGHIERKSHVARSTNLDLVKKLPEALHHKPLSDPKTLSERRLSSSSHAFSWPSKKLSSLSSLEQDAAGGEQAPEAEEGKIDGAETLRQDSGHIVTEGKSHQTGARSTEAAQELPEARNSKPTGLSDDLTGLSTKRLSSSSGETTCSRSGETTRARNRVCFRRAGARVVPRLSSLEQDTASQTGTGDVRAIKFTVRQGKIVPVIFQQPVGKSGIGKKPFWSNNDNARKLASGETMGSSRDPSRDPKHTTGPLSPQTRGCPRKPPEKRLSAKPLSPRLIFGEEEEAQRGRRFCCFGKGVVRRGPTTSDQHPDAGPRRTPTTAATTRPDDDVRPPVQLRRRRDRMAQWWGRPPWGRNGEGWGQVDLWSKPLMDELLVDLWSKG